jgi:hypothetical protein
MGELEIESADAWRDLVVFHHEDRTMIDVPEAIAHFTSITGFTIALPLTIATYYQSFKTRQEARDAREGTLHSMNCLEFVTEHGQVINLVPLETLHSLPRVGDIVFLPGEGLGNGGVITPAAHRVESIEHIYSQFAYRKKRPMQARLTKAVAQVTSLNPTMEE